MRLSSFPFRCMTVLQTVKSASPLPRLLKDSETIWAPRTAREELVLGWKMIDARRVRAGVKND